jgi:predicted nicotinamide N-methyase
MRYEVVDHRIQIGGTTFAVAGVRDTNALVDAINPAQFADDERLPYWSELWTSSIELARFILTQLPVAGTTVLELGCGLGLAGIAASFAGACVVMTDYEEDALMFALYNALRNQASIPGAGSIMLRHLDWRQPPPLEKCDYILGADIAYERRNFIPILELLARTLVPTGTVVLADPDRSIAKDFLALALHEGYTVSKRSVPAPRNGPTASVIIALLQMKGGA